MQLLRPEFAACSLHPCSPIWCIFLSALLHAVTVSCRQSTTLRGVALGNGATIFHGPNQKLSLWFMCGPIDFTVADLDGMSDTLVDLYLHFAIHQNFITHWATAHSQLRPVGAAICTRWAGDIGDISVIHHNHHILHLLSVIW